MIKNIFKSASASASASHVAAAAPASEADAEVMVMRTAEEDGNKEGMSKEDKANIGQILKASSVVFVDDHVKFKRANNLLPVKAYDTFLLKIAK